VAQWGEWNRLARVLCYRCGSHVPDSAERCATCGQRQVGTARMPSATGLRKKLNPALLVGSPYREGELMANRYQVKDAVGVGPLGFVLRAADKELGIDVAVKLIHPRFVQTKEEREAFAQALEPAKHFLHPSLTRLHDVGNDQGWPYFTYTFLEGLSLRRIIDSRLAKGQTFALDEVEPILGQLMAALEAVHPAGAHGDLKAENILVLPDMLKVTDWGVAAGVPRPPFVQAERQKAVHRHLAPEYLAGLSLEPRADVYSMGVLVGEMLTGLTPEDEIPELRLVNPELPDAVEGFYRRALSERSESRFRSVREMFEAFTAVVEGKSPEVTSAESAEDGFEVVDFNETQMVVVQPDPPAAVAAEAPPEAVAVSALPPPAPEPVPVPVVAAEPANEPEPVRPEPPADLSGTIAQEVAAEVAAQVEAAVESALPKDDAPAAFAANSEPDTAAEEEFWQEAESASPAVVANEGPLSGTLWSDDEDEEDAEDESMTPRPSDASSPALSLAEAPAQPPSSAASISESGTVAEASPVRPVPMPHVVPRNGGPVPATPPTPRPVVPAVGIWGPGARRTGAHAAVAVALPEAPASAEAMPPVPFTPPEVPVEAVPPVRAVPAPVVATSQTSERLAAVSPVSVVPPPASESTVSRPKVVVSPAPVAAHEGGLWSPGAALAELVSEMRSEDARRLPGTEGDAAPAAKAAQVVTEQRASRERLALMSAGEEPTAPAPSVSGRPRKTASTPVVAAPASLAPRDKWLRLGLLLAVFFAVGMAAAALVFRAF
jgi:eukaryotic-like serine/threonine-protein kinase